MSLPPKVLLLCLALFLYMSVLVCGYTQEPEQSLSNELFRARGRRMLDIDLDDGEEDPPIKKKKPTITATATTKKNQTKLIKPTTITATGSSKNQTKLFKVSSAKNQTKPIKLKLNSNSLDSLSSSTKNKTKLFKPTNSTKPISKSSNSTKPSSKSSNSTKPSSILPKKTSDLTKLSPPKNKTTKLPSTAKQSETLIGVKSKNPDKIPSSSDKKPKLPITQKPKQPSWIDQEDEDDLVSGFRDLPTRFQEQLLPDLERISTTSKVYLSKANKEMTKGFKPFVGNKYASTVASIVSFAFILIPLLLVSLVVNRIKAYFSVQKLVIFIQVYLSIYFSILCLSSLVTGLEPLKFFYSTSQSTYVCLQVLQTLGYVLYLLLLLMYLVLVFGTESGPGSKVLGLVQTFVGFAVGLHYYVTVFHRVVLHQPPKTNWKVHGIYATCFLAICLLANADRRKKAYLEEGGEEGKKS